MTDERREADNDDAAADADLPAAPPEASAGPAAPVAEPSSPPAAPRRGRGLALLALLLALAAAGAAGYLYYRLLYQAPLATLADQLDARLTEQQRTLDAQRRALDEQAAALRESLRAELTAEFDAELARVRSANEDALTAAEAAMAEALRFEARSRAPAERLWGLAEVDYLLRTAAAYRSLARDLPVAAALLRRADRALATLDDDAFDGLREALADELDRLDAYQPVDVQAIYLELETLQERIAGLPLAMPATGFTRLPPAPERATNDAAPGFWQQLRAQLEELLSVRRLLCGLHGGVHRTRQAQGLTQHARQSLGAAAAAAGRGVPRSQPASAARARAARAAAR